MTAPQPDPYAAAACYYDLLQDEHALPSVPFFAALAQPGCEALEMGAGTGRVALKVAERAALVYCVEPSASMRAALLGKLAQRPDLLPKVTVVAQPVPGPQLGRQFDYAYLPGVLEHIPHSARRGLLRWAAGHLREGGLFALDMVLDELVTERQAEVIAEGRAGECRYVMRLTKKAVSADQAWNRLEYETYRGGELADTVTVERDHMMHRSADVIADLEAEGFTVIGGSARGAPTTAPHDGGTLIARFGNRPGPAL
jgi:SAM-dependent methyltransferase